MKKLIILMMSVVFALSVPLVTMADANGGGKGDCSAPRMKHMERGRGMEGKYGGFGRMGHGMMFKLPWFYLSHAKDLKLSDEQVASLKKLSFELKKEMITKGADAKIAKLELREMLSKPDYKLEDANAKLKEVGDARMALASTLLSYSVKARDILTADQLAAVKDLRGQCGNCEKKGMRRPMQDNEDEE